MIVINDFQKFYTVLTELDESNIQYKLYGNMEETFSGAHAGFDTPPNNTLRIKLVALTTIGTIFCNSSIKLANADSVQLVKQQFSELSVSESGISYNKDSGNITIS